MPTYDYVCKDCGYQFEMFQSMKEKPLSTCPACGKDVKRLIGGGLGVIFKGSGFYSTDNKRSSIASTTTSSAGSKENSKTNSEPAPVNNTETKSGDKKESVNV